MLSLNVRAQVLLARSVCGKSYPSTNRRRVQRGHSTSLCSTTQYDPFWSARACTNSYKTQLLIMHGSTQERFKHAVPPQTVIDRFRPQYPPPPSLPDLHVDPGNCRINITFRFYRPDFHPDMAPKCACGGTATLRPDMKKRQRETAERGETERRGEGEFRYWWVCTAGDQNEGKGIPRC